MGRLAEFRTLPNHERAIIGTVGVLLVASRVLLPLVNLDRTRQAVGFGVRVLPPYEPVTRPSLVPWAVRAVDRSLPVSFSCLMHALVAEALFAGHGYPSHIRFGVKHGEGDLEAHAWVVRDGRVVVGDLDDLSRYHPLEKTSAR